MTVVILTISSMYKFRCKKVLYNRAFLLQIIIFFSPFDQKLHFFKQSYLLGIYFDIFCCLRILTSSRISLFPYDSLRTTITINILNFPVFSAYETFHTTGKLWDIQLQKLLLDDLELHVIEIPKLMAQWKEEQVNPWEDSFVR